MNSCSSRHIVVYGTSLSAEHSVRFWRRCGGSWVRLLRDHLERHGAAPTVTNVSHWGADSRWARRHFLRRVWRKRPDDLILEFAINDADLRNGISIPEAARNLEWMGELAIDANPGCMVWLMTSHVPQGRHSCLRPALEEYYEMYRVVASRRNFGLIDLHARWGRMPPEARYVPDGLHPNLVAARDVILPAVLSAPGFDKSCPS